MIKLIGIAKTYVSGGRPFRALHNIDFSIKRGAFVAIVGASGSGKSTLLNIIGTLDRADAGEYHFDGIDITHADDNALAQLRCKKIGFVFQGFHLIPQLSVRQNIEQPMVYRGWPAALRRARTQALLAQVKLPGKADARPLQLSGGQQQRIALARALANDPDVLIADEPTGNLDSDTAAHIMDIFAGLKQQGKTIVLVTHDTHVAASADYAIELHDGAMVLPRGGR